MPVRAELLKKRHDFEARVRLSRLPVGSSASMHLGIVHHERARNRDALLLSAG